MILLYNHLEQELLNKIQKNQIHTFKKIIDFRKKIK